MAAKLSDVGCIPPSQTLGGGFSGAVAGPLGCGRPRRTGLGPRKEAGTPEPEPVLIFRGASMRGCLASLSEFLFLLVRKHFSVLTYLPRFLFQDACGQQRQLGSFTHTAFFPVSKEMTLSFFSMFILRADCFENTGGSYSI